VFDRLLRSKLKDVNGRASGPGRPNGARRGPDMIVFGLLAAAGVLRADARETGLLAGSFVGTAADAEYRTSRACFPVGSR